MRELGVVESSERVADYFSAQAAEYQPRSRRLPWSWLRRRELNAVRSLLGDVTGFDILELGAGAGFYTREFVQSGARHVWAVDLSEAMLASLPPGPITRVVGNAAEIELGRCFEVIVCAGMMEFVTEPASVLANAARHAKPRARFVILAPRRGGFSHLYRHFHRRHDLNIHLFDRGWFEMHAPRVGWQIAAAVAVPPFSLAVRLVRV
jgi:SAM-dependent methyltransferase